MNLRRRALLQSAGGLAALLATALPSLAQIYPSRSLRWIVGFAPGGAADVVARIVATSLSHRLGQQVVVENKSGAGTNVATRNLGDVTGDGVVNLFDFAQWKGNYPYPGAGGGGGGLAGATVPEPASVALLALGLPLGWALMFLRKRNPS